jgi:integrase
MPNFTQRENGKWQAKIRRHGWPEQSKTFQTLEAAQQWARAIEREMDINAFINRDDAERTTVSQAAARYVKEVLPGLRGARSDQSRINRLIEAFGPYSLAAINPAMISAYRDNRLKAVAPQTVVHEINMLSRIFKACAMDWGIALPQGIPTTLVRKPKLDNSRDRRLEHGEWNYLSAALSECQSDYPLAAATFDIETAARQSEIVSLTWDGVDLKKKTARLRGIDGGPTKNGDPYRDVPLSPPAVDILTRLPRSLKDKRVFRLTQNALKLSWQRAVTRARKAYVRATLWQSLIEAGYDERSADAQIRAVTYHKKVPNPVTVELLEEIEKTDTTLTDLHFHDLRHEATSRLAEKLQMHELMKVTGHKSSGMLARYYHPRAEDLALKLA